MTSLQDQVVAQLRKGAQSAATLAQALQTAKPSVLSALGNLREAGRVEQDHATKAWSVVETGNNDRRAAMRESADRALAPGQPGSARHGQVTVQRGAPPEPEPLPHELYTTPQDNYEAEAVTLALEYMRAEEKEAGKRINDLKHLRGARDLMARRAEQRRRLQR